MQRYLQAMHRPQVSSDVQGHMEKIQICDKVYQRGDACPAAEECLRLMWRLTVSVIQSWVHKPQVFAAVSDSLARRNAAFPRRALVMHHFQALVRCIPTQFPGPSEGSHA